MFVRIDELDKSQIILLLKKEHESEPNNVYIFSEDDFAHKIVHEVKNTSLEVMANIKGMTTAQFCSYLTEAVIATFDTISVAFIVSLYKLYEKKIPSKIIAKELGTVSEKIDEIIQRAKIIELAEQIEDEEIVREITKRAEKYGGVEAMLNAPGIPADEVYKRLGIADVDLSQIDDVDIA
jgi:hypothetical protein